MNSDVFYQLSVDLVGESELDHGLATGLMTRLLTVHDAHAIRRLEEVASRLPIDPEPRRQAIAAQIMQDDELRALAKEIIVLWYTGDLLGDPTNGPTEEQYFQAHVWSVARAHPPGLSGGYFGHWTYPPDN